MVGGFQVQKVLASLLLSLLFSAIQLRAAPWRPLGPDGGDARRITPDPSDHTHLYLGTANGWIYESHTSGVSWVRLAQIGQRDDLVLDSIVVDSSNPKHLLVGAWVLDRPDGGLFISNDSGHTWTNKEEMRGQSVRALTESPSDPKVFVAGSLQNVFRSVDSGQHWNRVSPADSTEIHEIQSVAIDPMDSNVIYAGTWHLPWKTVDAGEHWTPIKQGIIDDSDVFSIIVDPTSPQTVYASACSGIYKSEDAGNLFHKVEGIPSTARRTRVLLQDPHQLETVFAGTTEGLFRSTDAGRTWTRTTGPEIIVNDVFVDLGDAHRVLLATNRGGVLASDDGGDTFHSSNGGFSTRQITALKRDVLRPDTLFVGIVNDKDWGGVFQSKNGGINWFQQSDGLHGRDVFSLGQAPDGTMIAGTAHGIYRLDSSVNSWQRVENTPGDPPASASPSHFLPITARHPVLASSVRVAQNGVIKSQSAIRRKSTISGAGRHSAIHSHPAPANKRPSVTSHKGGSATKTLELPAANRQRTLLNRSTRLEVAPTASAHLASPTSGGSFDGSVYSIVTAGRAILATTSSGLLTSMDNGLTWVSAGPHESTEWRLLASAKNNVVAASLHAVQFSPDSGATWSPIALPRELTQVSALAVEPSGEIWLGSREGVFVSADAGNLWSTPKNVFVNSVNSIFYDEAARAVTVTTAGANGVVFTVQLPQRSVSYYESGWTLRFAQPVGDHLVAATLFDGLVVQPRMVVSPPASSSPSSATFSATGPSR